MAAGKEITVCWPVEFGVRPIELSGGRWDGKKAIVFSFLPTDGAAETHVMMTRGEALQLATGLLNAIQEIGKK